MKRIGLIVAGLGLAGFAWILWPNPSASQPTSDTIADSSLDAPAATRSSPAAARSTLEPAAEPSIATAPSSVRSQPAPSNGATAPAPSDQRSPPAAPTERSDNPPSPAPAQPASSTVAAPAPPLPAPSSDDADPRPGSLKDRTGRGGTLVQQLNEELMPLISECMDMAQERDPQLVGLLSISVQLIPTDDGQALVESVELQEDNTVLEPELIECIEQSTLSVEGMETTENFALSLPLEAKSADR